MEGISESSFGENVETRIRFYVYAIFFVIQGQLNQKMEEV
jgi:hypothetical protein